MTTPPTAALFDIGNVLVHLNFERELGKLLPSGTTDRAERLQGLLEKRDELETGALATADFITWACARLGFDGPPSAFRDAWNAIFAPIDAMWDVARHLNSRQLKLLLFSNTNAMHAEWLLAHYDIFGVFDAHVFSHEVGAIKPDPAIYHHAIAQHQLVPAETLYIDDLPANIATGRALGFRCHEYAFARHDEFAAWLTSELAGN